MILALVTGQLAMAQEGLAYRPGLLLRVNPAALIDPYGPSSIQVGLEYPVTAHTSVAMESGYFFQYRPALQEAVDDAFTGYMVRLQAVRWSDHSHGDQGLGFDVAYKYTKGTCRDSIKPENASPYSKDYGLTRSVVIMRGYGIQRIPWGDRFLVEVHYGFGVRYKSARSSGISAAELEDIDNRDDHGDGSMIPGYIHAVGDRWYPDLAVGIRICYAIK